MLDKRSCSLGMLGVALALFGSVASCDLLTVEVDRPSSRLLFSEVRVGNNVGAFVRTPFPRNIEGSPVISWGTYYITETGKLLVQVQPVAPATTLHVGISSDAEGHFVVDLGDIGVSTGNAFGADTGDSAQSSQPVFGLVMETNLRGNEGPFTLSVAFEGSDVSQAIDFDFRDPSSSIDNTEDDLELGSWVFSPPFFSPGGVRAVIAGQGKYGGIYDSGEGLFSDDDGNASANASVSDAEGNSASAQAALVINDGFVLLAFEGTARKASYGMAASTRLWLLHDLVRIAPRNNNIAPRNNNKGYILTVNYEASLSLLTRMIHPFSRG